MVCSNSSPLLMGHKQNWSTVVCGRRPFPHSRRSLLGYGWVLCRAVRSLLSHRGPCQCREAMAAWHVVMDGSGLRLSAAATKAHSGWDNGELGGWVVFYHSALSLSLSVSRGYCVDCLTLSICCQLVRTRSQIGPRFLSSVPETLNLSVLAAKR